MPTSPSSASCRRPVASGETNDSAFVSARRCCDILPQRSSASAGEVMTLEACPRGVVVGGAIAHPSGLRRKLAPKSRAAPAHKPPSWDRVPAVVAVVWSKFWFPGRGKLFGSCRKPLHGPSHSGRPRPSATRLMGTAAVPDGPEGPHVAGLEAMRQCEAGSRASASTSTARGISAGSG